MSDIDHNSMVNRTPYWKTGTIVLTAISCAVLFISMNSTHEITDVEVREVVSLEVGNGPGQVYRDIVYPGPDPLFVVDGSRNIIILDRENNRIHKFTPEGVRAWTYRIPIENKYATLYLGSADQKGNVYISEMRVHEAMAKNYRALHKVSPAGKLVYKILSASLEYEFYDTNYYIEDSGEVYIIGFSRKNWNKPIVIRKYSPSGALESEGTKWTGCCCNEECGCQFTPFLNQDPLCMEMKNSKGASKVHSLKESHFYTKPDEEGKNYRVKYRFYSGPDKEGNYYAFTDVGDPVSKIDLQGNILWELSPMILEKITPYKFASTLDEIHGKEDPDKLNYDLDKYVVGEWLYANGSLYALAVCPKCDKGFLKIFKLDIKD